MAAQRFRGPVLPDGEARDLYVVDGLVTYEPQAGAETVAEGWIVPGLVDAHCHVGLDENGAVDDETSEQQAITDRDAGALLLRDCGSAADTSWIHEREDLPRLIRAGRHIARTKRYIRNFAHEVEPDELAAYVAQEAQRGDGWVKLVGDWIERDAGDLAPSFPADAFAEAIAVAHEHGAKVTAHCFGEAVLPGLIEAGIDCIEHGTGLSRRPDRRRWSSGRTALVPTVLQLNKFPDVRRGGGEKFPKYAEHMLDLHGRRRDTIMAAHEAGVAIYAGTDAGGVLAHGNIADEVARAGRVRLHARARRWVPPPGAPGRGSGSTGCCPRARRPTSWSTTATRSRTCPCWRSPSAIVLRGRVVAG